MVYINSHLKRRCSRGTLLVDVGPLLLNEVFQQYDVALRGTLTKARVQRRQLVS